MHLQEMGKMHPTSQGQLSYGEETIRFGPWTDLVSNSRFLFESCCGQAALSGFNLCEVICKTSLLIPARMGCTPWDHLCCGGQNEWLLRHPFREGLAARRGDCGWQTACLHWLFQVRLCYGESLWPVRSLPFPGSPQHGD